MATLDKGTSLTLAQVQSGPFTADAPFVSPVVTLANDPTIVDITFTTNVGAADLVDQTKSVVIIVQCQDHNTLAWANVAQWAWQGNAGLNPKTGLPWGQITFGMSGDTLVKCLGKSLRAEFVIPVSLLFGGTLAVR